MPATILTWKQPTRRPRHWAGDNSAMYIGASTDEPPIPNPPMIRKAISDPQFHDNAQPSADKKKNTAIIRRLSRRPHRSPGYPAVTAPTTVPHKALETVIPNK